MFVIFAERRGLEGTVSIFPDHRNVSEKEGNCKLDDIEFWGGRDFVDCLSR